MLMSTMATLCSFLGDMRREKSGVGDYSNIAESCNQSLVLMPGYQNQAAGTFLPSSIKKIAVSGTCKRKVDFNHKNSNVLGEKELIAQL